MTDFIAFCRRILARRFGKGVFGLAALYSIYLVYVSVNYVVVPHGLSDPVYLITGVRRSDQIVIVTIAFGLVLVPLLIRHFSRDGLTIDFAANSAMKRGTLLLLALIFFNSVVASLAVVLNELDSQFWAPLFGWVATVLALQMLIVYAALSWIKQWWVHLALLSVLSGINLFALYLSLLGKFLSLSDAFQIAVIVLTLLLFTLLFALVGKRIFPLRSVNAVLIVTMLGPVAMLAVSPSTAPEKANRLAPFNDIEFHSKPNIHIVSIDALSPIALTEKYMGLSGLPYARLLQDDGVLVFRNAFASQVSTGPSLNSLMRLAHADFANTRSYFAGRTNGPVTHILHRNGYTVSTGFNQQFFGYKGPFVDFYVPVAAQSVGHSTLCALASENPYKFFGFCGFASLVDDAEPSRSWPDEVVNIVGQSAKAPDAPPAFTLHYIFNPIGHTNLNYNSADRNERERYASQYRDGAVRVAEIMERLKETVRGNAAASILIVMGDHGPFLSRTVSADDNPTFVVQDQHGILAAVLVNNTACTTRQLQHYAETYATPERILAGVMRCLSRDPARFDAVMKFEEAYEFKNFLYE